MWENVKAFFRDSETIFWARLQMLGGAVLAVLIATDLSPLIANGVPTKQQMVIAGIVFLQGVVTEYLRRRRAEDM